MTENKFDITWSALWKIFVFLGILAVFYFAKTTIGILLVGVSLSLGIEPVISFISEKIKINRFFSVIFVFLLLVTFGVIFLYLIFPVFINEIFEFLSHLNEVLLRISQVNFLFSKISPDFIKGNIPSFFISGYKSTSSTFLFIIKSIIFAFSSLIISLYLSLEKDGIRKMLEAIIPDFYEKSILVIFNNFEKKIKKWLFAQIILSGFIGIAVFVGTFLIGVKYPLILGITAGVLEVVPIIGPIISGFFAFVVAISQSFNLAIYVLIFFVLLQQLENHLLVPLLIGKTMKIHPVVVLFSLLAGSEIAGIAGVILAVPIAILIQEVFFYLSSIKNKRYKN